MIVFRLLRVVAKRWALRFLLMPLTLTPVAAQTIVFSGVPSNVTVQCLADVPSGLQSVVVGAIAYGVPSNAVVGVSVGDVITLHWWTSPTGGNWGVLNLCGPIIGHSETAEAIESGVSCEVSVGDIVTVGSQFDGIKRGFASRYNASPTLVMPVVDSFPSGNHTVRIQGFIVGLLLEPGSGGGSGWSIDLEILSAVPFLPNVTSSCGDAVGVVFSETRTNPTNSCNNLITRTWTATDSCANTAIAVQTIWVADTTSPLIACPATVTLNTDTGQCTASNVNLGSLSASDNCYGTPMVSNNAPAAFPKGTNEVIWTATDSCGNSATCTQWVIVVDEEAPRTACRPAPNPSGKKIPGSGKNPSSGQNPDGYYQLLANDNCDPNPVIYVQDTRSAFRAGPFVNGDIVKIIQNPGRIPRSDPGTSPVVAHIHLNGDALGIAVDAAGNETAAADGCLMLIPPDPK